MKPCVFNDGNRLTELPTGLQESVSKFWCRKGFDGIPRLTAMDGDGSARSFFRVRSEDDPDRSFVVMWNPPLDSGLSRENLACELIGKHLFLRGVPVPEIFHVDRGLGCLVMEDLGDTDLQRYSRTVADPIPVFERVLDVLLHLQAEGAKGFDPGWCCQTANYDLTVMIQLEACYFRDAFLRRYAGITGKLDRLDGCFLYCAKMASRGPGGFFLHRDFQSRNIMISDGKVRIVDWQGGRLGPPGYDMASLAIDPYTELSGAQRAFLVEGYFSILRHRSPSMAEAFRETYPYLAVQRNMQILGAFAYLSKVRGKPAFESCIEPSLKRLEDLLEELSDPGLRPLAETILQIDRAALPR